MATRALGLCVPSMQRVFGIHFVIELRRLPAFGGVAAFAFLTELPSMAFLIVSFAVTSDTGLRGILVNRVLMAFGTLSFDMLARKRKLGLFVVELRLLPVCF
jgi:hypothetical protein